MSSIKSGGSRSRGGTFSDNTVVKFWNDHAKANLFGIMYAMVKENIYGYGITITAMVVEFILLVLLCFRSENNWRGFNFSFYFSDSFIGYDAWFIIFWATMAIGVVSYLATAYMGYSFYKGEIRSVWLLKGLRIGVSVATSIMFVPFLYIIFSGLACDYSTNPPSLLLYPSHSCWGDNTYITIIGIVMVFVYILATFLSGFNVYEFDPSATKACSRIQNRFEMLALLVKTALVIVTVFLINRPQAFVATSFISSLILFASSLSMLPFYNHKLNLARTGLFGGVLWVNLWMVISYVMDDKDSLIAIIAATCGIPFAIAAGAFAADRRFKYLCDPTLVDGYISSTEEMETLPVQNQKKGRRVNWEKPKTNKLMKNKLFARLLFPWDVEIAARFVHSDTPSASILEKAKAVYQTGLSKFPKSPTVMQAYANFLFTTVGDWQLGYVVLEKLRKMWSAIDIQFFIYRYDKDRERRTEGGSDKIGDFVDFMEYKKMMQDARRHHMSSLVSVRRFWHYLLEPKVDVMRLSELSNRIALAEKRATEQYAKLLNNHPKNVRILRDYARFLEEVVLDEHAAQEVRKKADKYEILEMEMLTASHRSSSSHPEPAVADKSDTDSKSNGRSDLDSIDDTTISSQSSGVRAQLISAKLDKSNSLKKLGYIMLATTLLAMTVGFTELGILNSQLTKFVYSVDTQNTAAGASQIAARITRGVADGFSIGSYVSATGTNLSTQWGGTYDEIKTAVHTATVLGANCLRSLYFGTSDPESFKSNRARTLAMNSGRKLKPDISDHIMSYEEFDHKMPHKQKIRDFFANPKYEERIYVESGSTINGLSSTRQVNSVDLWSLSSIFMTFAYQVTQNPLQDFNNMSKYLADNMVANGYCFENSPSIASGMVDLVDLYSLDITNSLTSLLTTVSVIFAIASGLLIIGAVVIFRPTVQKIFATKVHTFTMFTLIPTSVVKIMSKKRIISMNADSSDDEEEEGDTQDAGAPIIRRNSNAFPKWKGKDMTQLDEDESEPPKEEGAILHTPRAPPIISSDNKSLLSLSSSFEGHQSASQLISVDSINSNNNNNTNNNNNNNGGKSDSMASSIDLTTKSTPTTILPESVKVNIDDNDNIDNNNINDNNGNARPTSAIQSLKRKFSGITLALKGLQQKNNYNKIEIDPKEEEKKKKEKKKNNASRLDVSSLRAVTRKLHLSYLFGLTCIFVALLISFVIIRNTLDDMKMIAGDLGKGGKRTQYTQLVATDVALFPLYTRDNLQSERLIANFEKDMKVLQEVYNSVSTSPSQMDVMYSPSCLSINKASCFKPGDPLYDKTNSGVEYLYFQVLRLGQQIHLTYKEPNSTINITDPSYIEFRVLSDILIDGMERLMFLLYTDTRNKISDAGRSIAITTAVECIIFAFIYILLFRPFVKQLRREIEHTFAMIRVIPRKLLQDVPEIQEFLSNTMDDNDDPY